MTDENLDENKAGIAMRVALARLFMTAHQYPLAVAARDCHGLPDGLALDDAVAGAATADAGLQGGELLTLDADRRTANQLARP